jgi:hypothetical protein
MGAWGVQYYLYLYLATNVKDAAFLTIPISALTGYYSQIATDDAARILISRFCMDK